VSTTRGPATAAAASPAAEGCGALEEERDFFLRSLRDLEAERSAGDIDEVDYRALRDDYTARAAEVLRWLERPSGPEAALGPSGREAGPPVAPDDANRRPSKRLWKVGLVAAVVVVAAAAGWRVGTSGSSSGTHMGAPQVEGLLVDGQSVAARNPVAALGDFHRILQVYPDQPQALTDEGWVLAQGGVVGRGEEDLRRAEAVAPGYDLPHAYLGYLLGDQRDFSGAVSQLQYYLDHGPDPALAAEARAALAAARGGLANPAARPGTATPAGG